MPYSLHRKMNMCRMQVDRFDDMRYRFRNYFALFLSDNIFSNIRLACDSAVLLLTFLYALFVRLSSQISETRLPSEYFKTFRGKTEMNYSFGNSKIGVQISWLLNRLSLLFPSDIGIAAISITAEDQNQIHVIFKLY